MQAQRCVYPDGPDKLPDGNTATQQEMVDAMAALKKYDAEVTAYTNCLEMETDSRIQDGGKDMSEDQVKKLRAIQAEKHNAAVDALQTRATEFNEQVRLFKAKHKS